MNKSMIDAQNNKNSRVGDNKPLDPATGLTIATVDTNTANN
jgi:hypothetical protein